MRMGFWRKGLIGGLSAAFGAAAGWAGLALMAPERAGLTGLPPEVAHLPFERAFWATALIVLGGAFLLHALPHPPWTGRPRSRS